MTAHAGLRSFGSDNHSGVHPALLQALTEANIDHAPSYGTDSWTESAIAQFQKIFGETTDVHFVFNGTGANVVALRVCLQSYESVLCSDVSHLNVDECGAPEFFTGGKLIPLPSTQGKISLENLQSALIRRGDQHFSQVKVVSLTQPTELGTCYTLQELQDIAAFCKKENLFLHIDGARLSNAVVTLQISFQKMITDLGVDIVSFGGTKNGFLFGEAVLVFHPQLKSAMKYLRKQSAQLPSKTRFVAAQFDAYLKNNLWLDIAGHSVKMAEKLSQGLRREFPHYEITAARESNAVFVKFPQKLVKKLRERYFFYVWDEKTFECRLMTSWDTTDQDVAGFLSALREAET
jgi:threonine aldolase